MMARQVGAWSRSSQILHAFTFFLLLGPLDARGAGFRFRLARFRLDGFRLVGIGNLESDHLGLGVKEMVARLGGHDPAGADAVQENGPAHH